MTTITTAQITADAVVTIRRRNAKGQIKIKTGTVDGRYLPDEVGEMMVRISGKLYCCNVTDVTDVIEVAVPKPATTITLVRLEVARFDRDVAGTLGDVTDWSLSEQVCTISTDDVEALFTRLDADDNVLTYETVRA